MMAEHGTRSCYVYDECRCGPCSLANKEYQEKYQQRRKPRRNTVVCDDLIDHVEALHKEGFAYSDMAAATGITTRTLWGIRRGDQMSVDRIIAGRLRRLTIADKPRLPVQQRNTPAMIAGRKRAREKRTRPEYRTVGLICPVCEAHVCPLDCHGRTCGQKTCVNRMRGRRLRNRGVFVAQPRSEAIISSQAATL